MDFVYGIASEKMFQKSCGMGLVVLYGTHILGYELRRCTFHDICGIF